MGSIRFVARADGRRRWRGLLAITLLIAVAGGVVITSVAGARRTSSAYERLRHETRSSEAAVDLFDGVDTKFASRIGRLENVAGWAQLTVWAGGIRDRVSVDTPIVAAVDERFGHSVDRSILVRGRRDRTVEEVVLPENVASLHNLDLGDRMRIGTYAPQQLAALRSSTTRPPAPQGPTITLRVVGIDRRAGDLTTQGQQTGILFLSPRVFRAYHRDVLSFTALVRVRFGEGSNRGFASRVRGISKSRDDVEFDTGGLDAGGIDDSLRVLGAGLLLFGGIGALAALATITVLVSRWSAGALTQQSAEHALGMTTRQRALALSLPLVPAVGVGTVLATASALAASPLMPIGDARPIEPHPGFALDGLVLGIGALAMLIILTLLCFGSALLVTRRSRWDGARRLPRVWTSRWSAIANAARLPVPAVIGSRMALERGSGTTAVASRSALAAAALGVAGIVAALIAGTSLGRVVDEPARSAWHFDAIVIGGRGLSADPNACGPRHSSLEAEPAIAAIAAMCDSSVTVDGRGVHAMGIRHMRGVITPTILRGRAPTRRTEIALGEKTIARLSKTLGDHVVVAGSNRKRTVRIVGTTLFPTPTPHDAVILADGALMAAPELARFGEGSFPQVVIRWRPGTDRAAAIDRVTKISGAPPIPPIRPAEINRLLQVDRLPAILALLGLVSVGHAVRTNGHRRRRDLALLQTLGFRSRQVVATIGAQALTLVLVGLVIGIPVGIGLGRLVWGWIARGVGIAPDASIPLVAIGLTIIGALLGGALVAAFPARSATRIHPAAALRSE